MTLVHLVDVARDLMKDYGHAGGLASMSSCFISVLMCSWRISRTLAHIYHDYICVGIFSCSGINVAFPCLKKFTRRSANL